MTCQLLELEEMNGPCLADVTIWERNCAQRCGIADYMDIDFGARGTESPCGNTKSYGIVSLIQQSAARGLRGASD
jgi:hypothetical protein